MKVAVASSDGVSISNHFGQSKCFIVFDIEADKIKAREVRENSFTAHALGQCHHDGQGHQHHGHSAIVGALSDCQVVLCYGMGFRAAQDLQSSGIKPLVLSRVCTPEQAVELFLKGELKEADSEFCQCHQ